MSYRVTGSVSTFFRRWIRKKSSYRKLLIPVRRPPISAQALVNGILAAREVELGCGDVEELIDRYAEVVQSGEDPHGVLPEVSYHLSICPDCREDLVALLRAIEAELTAGNLG